MAEARGSERVDEMLDALRHWQGIERKSMEQTAQILEQTSHPFVRLVMEVIRHDSLMHFRVQQALIDSLERSDVALTHEELGRIWGRIEAHDAAEKEVVGLGTKLRERAWSPLHKMLLDYLVTDEKKHDALLDQLGEIKRGLTRTTT